MTGVGRWAFGTKASLWAAILFNSILIGASSAGTFYVSPTGNDSNSCLAAQNISTPKEATVCAVPGTGCATSDSI